MNGRGDTFEFMSQPHVDRMNALLERAEEVRAACAALPAPRSVAYWLSNGPGGMPVHWHMSFAETVRFELSDRPSHLVFVGDWAQVIRASRASRDGNAIDPGVVVEGDGAVLAEVAPVMELARAAATVPVHFPEV